MYVEKGPHGPYWYVCQDDGTPIQVMRSKSAATRWMRDMTEKKLPTVAEVRGILKDQ